MSDRTTASERPTVGLVVDSPGRDLAGLVLLASELARRDLRVLLMPLNLRAREISALDPDLIVVNGVRKVNEEMLADLMECGYPIGLHDTEGGIGIIESYANVYDHYANVMAADPTLRDRVTFVTAWGSRVAERMVAKQWYREDQVTITGSPRFDFYHESLRAAALEATPGREPGEMILVIASFPAANPLFRSAEDEMALRAANTGYDRAEVDELRDRDIEAMHATIDLVHQLARDHPQAQFVFRPHPFERAATYVEHFEAHDNVEVIGGGTAESWVHRAKAVVVPNDCTVGVECAMAGVPALVTGWIVPDNKVDAVVRAGHTFDDAASLSERLGEICRGEYSGPTAAHAADVEQVISDWFHRADGASHRRLADVIEAAVTPGQRSAALRRVLHYGRPTGRPWSPSELQRRIRSALRLPARFSFKRLRVQRELNWDSSPKAFYLTDIEPTLAALNRHGVFAGRTVTARDAEPGRDYDFGYEGRTIVVESVPARAEVPTSVAVS